MLTAVVRNPGTPPPASSPSPPPSVGSQKAPLANTPDPALSGKLPAELAANEQYTVLRELGRGGMGVVYLAHNTMLDRLEVLKVLSQEMLERKGTRERFIREMQSAARLDHPNIVRAYSAPPFGRLLVFAMEYIEGHDLAKLVRARGPLPVLLACSFAHDAALGLEHAHERGMVHRDIKPGNLMYTKQRKGWTIKVLDFGLAKATSENPFDGSLTREGQMLGTVDYIAPEQSLNAQKADIRADIYSLGCTLYFLLTGDPPFEGTSLASILQAHHSIDARPLNLVRPEVPVELAAVVGKMMAKETHRRYQTPEEVVESLKPFCKGGRAGSGSSDGERPRPRSPETVEAAAVASPPVEPTPAAEVPVAAQGGAIPSSDPSLRWASMIAIPEPAGLTETKAKSSVSGLGRPRPPWARPVLAVAGVLLLGLIGSWLAGISTSGTKQRLLVPKDLPNQKKDVAGGKELIANRVNDEPPAQPIPLSVPAPTPDPVPTPGFVSLFNGKDRTGWKTNPLQPGNWRVENGVLIGSGSSLSHLYTERDDFQDFHLRVKARINDHGRGGVGFRTQHDPLSNQGFPRGLGAQISSSGKPFTGSLWRLPGGFFKGGISEPPVPSGQQFALEVIADGDRIVVMVDGKITAEEFDDKPLFSRGHIALEQTNPDTKVEFFSIEIKELPTTKPPAQPTSPA
jgi:serine/threonine protein kinase